MSLFFVLELQKNGDTGLRPHFFAPFFRRPEIQTDPLPNSKELDVTERVFADLKSRFCWKVLKLVYEARLRGLALLSWALLGAPEPACVGTRCRTNRRAASRTSEIPPTRRMPAKQTTTGTDNCIILSAPEASLPFHPVLSAISLFWVSSTESRIMRWQARPQRKRGLKPATT